MKHIFRILSLTLIILMMTGLTACMFMEKPQVREEAVTITVQVVHGDGDVRTFPIKTLSTTLRGALEQENLVKGEEGVYGLYIHEVDGERAVYEETGSYWAVYIGEEQAMTGVDGITLTEGEVYKLICTKG